MLHYHAFIILLILILHRGFSLNHFRIDRYYFMWHIHGYSGPNPKPNLNPKGPNPNPNLNLNPQSNPNPHPGPNPNPNSNQILIQWSSRFRMVSVCLYQLVVDVDGLY